MDPVTALLLGILGNVLEEIAGRLVVLFGLRLRSGERSQELAPAQVRRLVGRTADRLADLRRHEFAGLPDHEWRAAVEAVRDCLHAVAPIDLTFALDSDLEPRRMAAEIAARGAGTRAVALLGEGGRAAYSAMLLACCEQILGYVRMLPDFSERVQVQTLRDVHEVQRAVDRLAGADERREDTAGHRFEVRYLDQVVEALGRFELFGLVRGRAPRRHSFDKYVRLAVARGARGSGGDEDDEGLTGVGVDVATALLDHRRLLIRGGAGAGKTTLLQWLASNAARGTLPGEAGRWGPVVPFFVPLRQFAGRDLPAPDELPHTVAKMIAGEMPDRWVNAQLASGRALLLVDGVDELTAERRTETRRWLGQLATAYPDARYVVTTRPSAVDEDWLADHGFATFDLLSMSANGVRDFLARWHRAAREEYESEPDVLDWLDRCERGLADLLATRHELRRLAANPLLCGLICALYQDRNMHLPRDRKSLYDAALELLLVRWDENRGIRLDSVPSLNKEEQTVLLQRFAYSLVKNQDILVPREEAERRIAHAMRGLRPHHAEPGWVLQHTLERTGLLREPYPDQVQFVHRTFRDYLAAKEVVDSGDLNHLIEQAHLDHWHDVVIMAVAHARPRERERILSDLLRGNAQARAEPRVRDRLHLVAAACLEQADVMDTDETRRQVQQAAARLIPPASLDDAELLAKAGSFVLDLLPGPDGLSEEEAACVVRTAAMIGGEGARERIAQFNALDQAVVIDELLRAWRQSDDPESYARTVLAEVDFGERRLVVQRWSRVQYLRHLRRLTNVSCRGDLTPLDPLAAIPSLKTLELIQNTVLRSLAPLVHSPTLRVLHLAGCPLVRDLSPLARTGVRALGLHLMNADLTTLAGGALESLSIRDRAVAGGLEPIPADLPLRELIVENRPPDRSLRGISRWPELARLALFGVPDAAELRDLTGLPRLTELALHGPDSGPAVRALRALGPLRRLDVFEIPDGSRAEVLAALGELELVDVYVDGKPLAGE